MASLLTVYHCFDLKSMYMYNPFPHLIYLLKHLFLQVAHLHTWPEAIANVQVRYVIQYYQKSINNPAKHVFSFLGLGAVWGGSLCLPPTSIFPP